MKTILLKNSLFGLIQSVVNLILVFIVIPIFIKKLGIDVYGVFSLVMVAGNLNTFANLGLTSTLIKFIAEQGKSKESTIDIIVNFATILSIIIPLTFFAVYLNNFILHSILNVPINLIAETRILYFWILFANLILLIGQVFKSILDALQLIYITSIQQFIYNILYWGLILFSIMFDLGFNGIGISIFLSSVVWFIITITSALKNWELRSFNNINGNYKNSFYKQLNYSLKLYSSGLIGFLYEPFSKILVSNFVGVAEVGFYDIAIRLKNQIWGLILKVFYPLYPFIAEQKDNKIIKNLVHDIEQKTFLIILPIVTIVIFLTHSFIFLWIGENVDIISISVIIIISSHLLFSSTVIPNYQFLLAKGLVEKTIYIQMLNVTFNVLFFFGLVKYVGFYSIILGNVFGILSSFALSVYYQKKYLDSFLFDSIFQTTQLIFSFGVLLFFAYLLKMIIGSSFYFLFSVFPILIILVAIYVYKFLKLLRFTDIDKYFGTKNQILNKLAHFFYD